MAIKINKIDKLSEIETDIVVIPIHTYPHEFRRHPLPEIKLKYTLAYAQMRRIGNARLIERGKLIRSYGKVESRIIVWLPTGKNGAKRQFIDWIVEGLREIRKYGLHNKATIAFPAIGVYESDVCDVRKVYKMVKKFLGDGEKDVQFLINY